MSSAASATQTTPTQSPAALRTAAYQRAIVRASEAGLVGYKLSNLTYEVPSVSKSGHSHIVRVTGTRWFDLACDCAGSNHLACQHRAVVAFARHHGVSAKRPVQSTPAPVEAPVLATPARANLFGSVPATSTYVGWIDSANPNLPVHLQAEAARLDAINARADAIFQGGN